MPGDYDIDGDVDHEDYVAWKSSFGAEGSQLLADGNLNGRVDAADYTVWRDNLGRTLVPVPQILFGDYNQSGRVDAADYTRWRDTLGQIGLAPYSGADGNGDGVIGWEDYQLWKSHFGETVTQQGAGSREQGAGSGEQGVAEAGQSPFSIAELTAPTSNAKIATDPEAVDRAVAELSFGSASRFLHAVRPAARHPLRTGLSRAMVGDSLLHVLTRPHRVAARPTSEPAAPADASTNDARPDERLAAMGGPPADLPRQISDGEQFLGLR